MPDDEDKPKRQRKLVELEDATHGRIKSVADDERRTIPVQVDIALTEWLDAREPARKRK